jgi:hypothetical protein
MRDRNTRESPGSLGKQVDRNIPPPETALASVSEANRWIEMRTGHGPEGKNERVKGGSGGNRVRQESKRDVASGKSLGHDARANHGDE